MSQPQENAPSDLEYKDTPVRASADAFGLRPAPVPHAPRTGSQLTDEEREATFQSPTTGGISTQSGGTRTDSALGKSEDEGTQQPARRKRSS